MCNSKHGTWVIQMGNLMNKKTTYRNPNLGLVTKARGCKVAGQKRKPRVKESVRE